MTLDLLLVNPIFLQEDQAERETMSPYFPLGLLYLAAFLRERGFSVDVFDGAFADGIDDFKAALRLHDPQVVGLTVVKPNRGTALRLAGLAQAHGATVVVGGPDPTSDPVGYLQDPGVDLVVHHEGELTLAELLTALLAGEERASAFADIDGLAYRDEVGNAVVNPRRPFILNLDELPSPARELIDMERYLQVWRDHHGYASLSISVARGCPYGCEWCADAVHGQDFRLRSPESVVAEVKTLMQAYDIDRLRVVDDVDGIDRAWIEAWAEQAAAQDVELPFEALYEVVRTDIPMLDVRDSL